MGPVSTRSRRRGPAAQAGSGVDRRRERRFSIAEERVVGPGDLGVVGADGLELGALGRRPEGARVVDMADDGHARVARRREYVRVGRVEARKRPRERLERAVDVAFVEVAARELQRVRRDACGCRAAELHRLLVVVREARVACVEEGDHAHARALEQLEVQRHHSVQRLAQHRYVAAGRARHEVVESEGRVRRVDAPVAASPSAAQHVHQVVARGLAPAEAVLFEASLLRAGLDENAQQRPPGLLDARVEERPLG